MNSRPCGGCRVIRSCSAMPAHIASHISIGVRRRSASGNAHEQGQQPRRPGDRGADQAGRAPCGDGSQPGPGDGDGEAVLRNPDASAG